MTRETYYGDARPDVQAIIDPMGRRILDVGCGEGALGHALKQRGAARVAGIERDATAAGIARRRLDEVVEGDALSAPLPSGGPFDWIVFADVLEHLAEPERALARFRPLLAPGGRIVVSVPNFRFWSVLGRLLVDRWSYVDAGIRDRTHLRVTTRRWSLQLVEDTGYVVESLDRKYRLFEDQSQIGRAGALATRAVRRAAPALPFRELLCFQYLIVARPSSPSRG